MYQEKNQFRYRVTIMTD